MQFGVHMAMTQVNMHSKVARDHPEWLVPGFPIQYFGATGLCLCVAAARDWLLEQVVALVTTYGVDYIVLDGEDRLKTCGQCPDSNYVAATHFDELWSRIREALPHLVVEHCQDGGNMETFKMVAAFDTSDSCDDGNSYNTRIGAWQHTYPFSAKFAAKYYQDTPPTMYRMRSASFGGPFIFMVDFRTFSAADLTLTKTAVAEYQRLRPVFWQDATAKVHHLMAPLFPPSVFPDWMPERNDTIGGGGWDAIQVVRGDGTAAAVFVFRALGGPDSMCINPRGLVPTWNYRLSNDASRAHTAHPDGPPVAMIRSGEQWMIYGINVTLDTNGSDLIELTRANSG